MHLRAGVHLGSAVSGDRYSIAELAQILNKNKIDVGILSDHLHAEVEYGIWPWRNLIKKRVVRPSIFSFGLENYFAEINKVHSLSKAILIPGAEVTPFYFWQGSLWNRNLTLRNWHRHLLIFGLTDSKPYANIPTVAHGLSGRFSISSLINLIYAGFFIVGLTIYKKRSVKTISFRGVNYHVHTRKNKIFGFVIMVLTFLLLLDNFPYTSKDYDAYHGDAGAEPYQNVIDYVKNKGGLVFWAHPEVEQKSHLGGVQVYSPPYSELLLQTYDYTGFAIFWEGMKTIGVPGGIWDTVLLEYCTGKRNRPVWAIGELDFEDAKQASLIRETSTIVLTRGQTVEQILEAFRRGRMYATRNFCSDYLKLVEFSLNSPDGIAKAVMGETLSCLNIPTIQISVASLKKSLFEMQLIRDGEIIERFEFDKFLEVKYYDKTLTEKGRHFYRLLLVEKGWTVLASNPIFLNLG